MPKIEELVKAIFRNLGILQDEQIKAGLKEQLKTKERLGAILLRLGYLNKEDVTEAFFSQLGVSPLLLRDQNLPPEVVSQLEPLFAKTQRLMPLKKEGETLVLATDNIFNFLALANLEVMLNQKLRLVLSVKDELDFVLQKYYGAKEEAQTAEQTLKAAQAGSQLSAGQSSEEMPIVQLVQQIIQEAVEKRASDIHLEPFEGKFRRRYRIDGVLYEFSAAPIRLEGSIISRIKIMAGMDIAEKRLPQDGRIRLDLFGKQLDLRVSSLPSLYGESLVMRILERTNVLLDLDQLGFSEAEKASFEKLISLPNGIFLVTGPTGSGKTTTLYTALSQINQPTKKIITVEDPVEYQISGINQVQVKPQIGLTFAQGLRAMLRQAPDVIMVGEIRDLETASVAIQASLTGHLILSTLHTNDAPSAIVRLVDMGLKPYLVASTLQGVLAQRLVRTICPQCREQYAAGKEELSVLKMKAATLYRGRGCAQCSQTGYKGRIGIFELMVVNEKLRESIYQHRTNTLLKEKARQEGMQTLREDGLVKAVAGLTTVEEVMRVTQTDTE
jgi:type II secretion system protein E